MVFGKTFTPETDIPDLSGKVILVTGGNTGLGKETILQLAKHDPSYIYLAARTPSKAEAAISEIKTSVPKASITYLPLDLSSLASVKDAADKFNSQSQRLDILMNNAGIMAVPEGETKDGYEIQFGTNHMGHALLTKLLLPTLLKTAEKQSAGEVRIVNLSSEGHNLAPWTGIIFDQAKLLKQGAWPRYGQSKLANILFARELARRYPTITSVAVHPGLIKTDLYAPNRKSNAIVRYGMMLMGPLIMHDVPEGARNQLWAATSQEGVVSGAYYKPVASKSSGSGNSRDEKLANKLWDWTENELTSKGY
ncbi:MAG: hypothetical protein M1827_001082 [Pycnora praestabilis]|nr:MAG: hypothetical protein M1827_001082 [Pycnora praestabilis]